MFIIQSFSNQTYSLKATYSLWVTHMIVWKGKNRTQ